MRNAALREREVRSDDDALPEVKSEAFAMALTELSLLHGIGITGEPVLFLMEDDDRRLAYGVDGESRLTLRAA